MGRWAVFCVLLLAFICRVIVHHGFYIISYAYGIYFLNLSLSFLSPLEDMEEKEYEGEEEEERDEYRPFVRRLPEFKYWFYATEWVLPWSAGKKRYGRRVRDVELGSKAEDLV